MSNVRRCSKRGMNASKSNLYKHISTKDALNPICKVRRRGYYIKNYGKYLNIEKNIIKKQNNQIETLK